MAGFIFDSSTYVKLVNSHSVIFINIIYKVRRYLKRHKDKHVFIHLFKK